jgi:hypothetical protein
MRFVGTIQIGHLGISSIGVDRLHKDDAQVTIRKRVECKHIEGLRVIEVSKLIETIGPASRETRNNPLNIESPFCPYPSYTPQRLLTLEIFGRRLGALSPNNGP